MERLARAATRREHTHRRARAIRRELRLTDLPLGERGAPLVGELLSARGQELGAEPITVLLRLQLDPGLEGRGLEAREGEQQIGQIPFDVDHQRGQARAASSIITVTGPVFPLPVMPTTTP